MRVSWSLSPISPFDGPIHQMTGMCKCLPEAFFVRECRNRSLMQDRALLRSGQPVPYRSRQLMQYERFRDHVPKALSLYPTGERFVNVSCTERDREPGPGMPETNGKFEFSRDFSEVLSAPRHR